MKSVIFDAKWENQLISGDKTIFINKGEEYRHLDELMVKIGSRIIGYSKIIRIRKIEGKELDNACLGKCGVTRYRGWIETAHKFGYLTVPQLLENIFATWDIDEKDILQIIEMHPVKSKPYNLGPHDKAEHANMEVADGS